MDNYSFIYLFIRLVSFFRDEKVFFVTAHGLIPVS